MTDGVEVIEEIEAPEIDAGEQDIGGELPNEAEVEEPEEAGLVVEIGGEEQDEGTPEWVKNVRRENRELKKRLKALEAGDVVTQATALPPEPSLEDFDYDAEAFKQAHKDWVKKSLDYERQEAERTALAEKAEQRWTAKLTAYEQGKERIAAPDFDDVEATVSEIFAAPFPGINAADVRMGIIKQGAKDPTTLVYALGRNPEKAKELAAIDDPVEFAFALGELSGRMKVVNKKAPPPEKKISSGLATGVTTTNDQTLDRLRAEAEKTGDYTKVAAYKRKLKDMRK